MTNNLSDSHLVILLREILLVGVVLNIDSHTDRI